MVELAPPADGSTTVAVPYLLDTNVISEARKRSPDSTVRAWLASVPESDLYLSVLVVGEIRQGIERLRRRDPGQAAPYETWLSALLRGFGDRLVPVTAEVCEDGAGSTSRTPSRWSTA